MPPLFDLGNIKTNVKPLTVTKGMIKVSKNMSNSKVKVAVEKNYGTLGKVLRERERERERERGGGRERNLKFFPDNIKINAH